MIAAAEAAAQSPAKATRFWRRTMFTTLKIAATVLIAVGGLFLAGLPLLIGAPVTFEEVAGKIQKARSLAYTMTSQIPGQIKVPVRLLFKEPGRMRSESVPAGGPVVIFDSATARRLFLDPATKSAVILEGRLPGEPQPGGLDLAASEATGLRQLAEKKGEAVGEKLIGKVRAKGFRVIQAPGYETIVWADLQTRLPVQVDVSSPYGDQTLRATLSNIQLDLELDDSLFSLEPPQGYALTKQSLTAPGDKDDGSPESAIMVLLRAYAQKNGGSFPKRIDDWRGYGEALVGENSKKPPMAEAMRVANLVARVQVFLLDRKGDYTYKPQGVKLGDADKMLLWYKPKGKDTYRALFGDLHVAEVPADRLPAGAKPAPEP
jgi:outer membrane lipoprotein-sorting protein